MREIRRWNAVTPLPNSDPSILGVMNLRGAVIPIVDLSTHLGFHAIKLGPRSVVVVVGIGSRVAGLVVDAVSEIISTPQSSIKPNPNINKGEKSNNITGLFSAGEEMLKVLSIDSLFDFDKEEQA